MALYFRVTDAGLAAATDAANQGLRLALTRFKLGSSYGYTPTGTETALAGTIVYDEPISSYKNMPDGSMIFVCSVLPAAGPFTFGEIGLFTDAGLLFAVATFPDPQDKYVSSGSSVNSTFTFNCHMNLTQRATQFNLSAATTPAAEIYMRWDQVVPLASMPDPRVLRVVINQPDSRGDQPTLSAKTGGGWTVDGVMLPLLSTAAVNSTTTYVDISADSWLGAIPGSLQSTVAGTSSTTLVVQVDANTFRLATAAVVGGAVRLTYTVALATAATGTVRLYSNDVQLKNTEAFLEQAVAGVATIANVATPSYVLSYTKNATGAVVESRASTLVFNAASAAFNVFAPPGISKLYTIVNNTAHTLSLYNSSVLGGTTSTQPALTVLTGHSTNVWTDGSRFYLQTRDLVYTNTQQTITGPKTFSQPIAGSTTTQVSLTGSETIGGVKTFNSTVLLGAQGFKFASDAGQDTGMEWVSDGVFRAVANGLEVVKFQAGSLVVAGSVTASGNVTGYSDMRLKKDWASLQPDFVQRLAKVKSGTYTRTDTGERQAGASAQDWQALLPEVVRVGVDEAQTLSLAYGNAALVACVELAKEVTALRAEINSLKSRLT
jgi:hypothetical protein